MTTLDPALCADGCGRLAETERPAADFTEGGEFRIELICRPCGDATLDAIHALMTSDRATLEDR